MVELDTSAEAAGPMSLDDRIARLATNIVNAAIAKHRELDHDGDGADVPQPSPEPRLTNTYSELYLDGQVVGSVGSTELASEIVAAMNARTVPSDIAQVVIDTNRRSAAVQTLRDLASEFPTTSEFRALLESRANRIERGEKP